MKDLAKNSEKPIEGLGSLPFKEGSYHPVELPINIGLVESYQYTPEELYDLSPNEILTQEQIADIKVVSNFDSSSAVHQDPERKAAVEAARKRLHNAGITVNQVTIYPFEAEEYLLQQNIPHKRGLKGLEVIGPHTDRDPDQPNPFQVEERVEIVKELK